MSVPLMNGIILNFPIKNNFEDKSDNCSLKNKFLKFIKLGTLFQIHLFQTPNNVKFIPGSNTSGIERTPEALISRFK